jgi:hypothetical protein
MPALINFIVNIWLNGTPFHTAGFSLRGISLCRAGWGAERLFLLFFCTFGRRQECSKQKLPHQLICRRWGKEKGFSMPHIFKKERIMIWSECPK